MKISPPTPRVPSLSLKRRALLSACVCPLLLICGQASAQSTLADSAAEFSGIQGQEDWYYGYRNLTLDGGGNDYDPETDFIAFPVDGTNFGSDTNAWNGTIFDFFDAGGNTTNPPWTTLGVESSHPNGTNQTETHWTVRRWTATENDLTDPTLLQVEWFISKTAGNPNGQGVTAQLHLNGTMVGKTTIAGDDTTGITKTVFVTADAGDHIDLVHTSEGPGGNTADGSDSSLLSMIISTIVDSDGDQLPDAWEETWAPGDLTVLSSGADFDSDGLSDEEEFANGTDPGNADTDGDGYPDVEEVDGGSSPSNPLSLPQGAGLADSREQFSDVQGAEGWISGYRNYSTDGGGDNYDPNSGFIDFPPDAWRGDQWRLAPSGAPWTTLGAENTHPNGTNSAPNEEHWTIRRWVASVDSPTDVRVYWTHRAANTAGDGTTGAIHLNGERVDSIAVSDGVGDTRSYYLTINNGDIIDQVVTPVGVSGSRIDGSDGSANWMRIDTKIPAAPVQPDGKYFIPMDALDSDGDSIPDFIETDLLGEDLTQLAAGSDWDADGAADEIEVASGSNPTISDTDGDGVDDGAEIETFETDPCNPDSDGDGLNDGDEVFGVPATDPNNADSDGDGFSDSEELQAGSDPNSQGDTPLSGTLADSVLSFSATQGESGWESGYRNVSLDGGGIDYDHVADFVPFPAESWRGTGWRLAPGGAPWTLLEAENSHPNGTNSAPNEEHWTVRRWTAEGLDGESAVRISWSTRKVNPNGDGVTGAVHLNGERLDSAVVSDTTGVNRIYYANISNGDVLDLILSPQGQTSAIDGSDGSANSMRIDNRIPAVAIQPDGSLFIPANAPDTDEDGIFDLWEEVYFPGNLDQLSAGSDYDSDGLLDEEEFLAGTNPTLADTDADGLADGAEAVAGTDPRNSDTDNDSFGDFHEVATGFDPLDGFSNVAENFTAIADSQFDFPFSDDPQGEYGWTHGYYDISADGEPPANSNFILFPSDGTPFLSEQNFWDGFAFDWSDASGTAVNPPWTALGALDGHPSGDNNGVVHWATRRWEVDQDAELALHYSVQKVSAGGNGVTAVLLHNGQRLHSTTIAGDDTLGQTAWSFVDARAGDSIELALSPRGLDGSDNDGSDGSNFYLIIDPTIPENPLQPDGRPFSPGEVASLRLIDFSYEEGNVTLRWTSDQGQDYQAQQSSDLQNWSNIGATVPGAAGGETEIVIPDAPASARYYRLLQLEP
ncbi:MAG: hypothetical protein DBX00_08420 [Verrucomicrobia bacterium]|nr:MAG: hypothetical protein DBX00_08420 [Verrucomicrobiota bacterium]